MSSAYDRIRGHFGNYFLAQNPGYSYQVFQQEAVCLALQALYLGVDGMDKLALFMPPRHGKSETATVNFPAWYLGHHPDRYVITISGEDTLAVRFGRKTKHLIETPLHQGAFPKCRISRDAYAADDFTLTAGGGYYARGLEGQILGRGAHLFVMDDLIKNAKDAASEAGEETRRSVFNSAVNTRLEPGGKLVLVMHRWPGDAFSGWLFDTFGSADITARDLSEWRKAA